MTNAISYAYTNMTENRLTLMDQFRACRDYAAALGYTVAAELNDIDENDHHATQKLLEEVRKAVADYGATVILVYQPSAWAHERLQGLGAEIEEVGTPIEQQRAL